MTLLTFCLKMSDIAAANRLVTVNSMLVLARQKFGHNFSNFI